MSIFVGDTTPNKVYVGDSEALSVRVGDTKMRPNNPPDYLCFTAEQANSTIKINTRGSPRGSVLQTSTDGETWTDYTIGNTITLSSVGDKVYWRNNRDDVGFSNSTANYYYFQMTGLLGASGDATYLLCKDGSNTAPDYCFYHLFNQCPITTPPKLPATTVGYYSYNMMFYYCNNLTTVPELPATTLGGYCYENMFAGCNNLTAIPRLPATTLAGYCYQYMFYYSPKIKLSQTQTGDYQTPYRIPTEGTGTNATGALYYMFSGTGGTFNSTPNINTTYYTSNTVV